MRTVSIRLDEATDARLRQIRARTGHSQTEAIKAAIAAFAEREEPAPAQSAAALDLIGCFDSGDGRSRPQSRPASARQVGGEAPSCPGC